MSDPVSKDREVPTLGEIAEVLKVWKGLGVTFESLLWVAREKVWWDSDE